MGFNVICCHGQRVYTFLYAGEQLENGVSLGIWRKGTYKAHEKETRAKNKVKKKPAATAGNFIIRYKLK